MDRLPTYTTDYHTEDMDYYSCILNYQSGAITITLLLLDSTSRKWQLAVKTWEIFYLYQIYY